MDAKNKTPFEAGEVMLDQGIKFKIPLVLWMKLYLNIKPLKPGTIIKLSQQVLKLKQVDEAENMVVELLKAGDNLKVHCRIIALGCLNNPVKIALFSRVLAWVLQWKVKSTTELLAFVSIVYKQMDAERFFFIMTLTKGMNFLNKKTPENSKAGTAFGEQ